MNANGPKHLSEGDAQALMETLKAAFPHLHWWIDDRLPTLDDDISDDWKVCCAELPPWEISSPEQQP